MDDEAESCSSNRGVESCSANLQRQREKLHVFNDVLRRLRHFDYPDSHLPSFHHHLCLHFNRLPTRYALDVNVERAEDVLMHMTLLRQAQDPATPLVFHLRLVQVNTGTSGHAGDSVHSYSSMDDGSRGSIKNSVDLGLSLRVHAPPTFGSSQNLKVHGLHSDVEDRDSYVNITNSLTLRAMHEITFSTADKPKLLSQLTSLLSEVNLNIQEAHAFSTVDGFSLDVFVVDGWPHEETEQLRSLLEQEISKMQQHYLKEHPSAALSDHHRKSSNYLHKKVVETASRNYEADIDESLLKIGCKVASGSYGDLYRGTYHGQEVAIKVLKPECVNVDMFEEFSQEVNIMRRVQHKNVLKFIGACTKPPSLYIVTEFMPNGNLYDFMHKKKGALEFQPLLRAAIDISMGMEYLHQNDIVHRDLKTANLLMDENGVVKVADFGIARVQTQPGVMTAETGTYRWMAPEVIGHKPYDHKADVFSFGIVLWELLTAELPYSHLTPLQAALAVVQKGLRPAIPKHTHPKLVDLLERCWHQDPNLRPNFSGIIEMLQQLASEVSKKEDNLPGGGSFSK